MMIPVDPASLSSSIERSVLLRTYGRVRNLEVKLAEQTVVLRGRAATHYTKQLAQLGALDELAGHRLVNEIVVG